MECITEEFKNLVYCSKSNLGNTNLHVLFSLLNNEQYITWSDKVWACVYTCVRASVHARVFSGGFFLSRRSRTLTKVRPWPHKEKKHTRWHEINTVVPQIINHKQPWRCLVDQPLETQDELPPETHRAQHQHQDNCGLLDDAQKHLFYAGY